MTEESRLPEVFDDLWVSLGGTLTVDVPMILEGLSGETHYYSYPIVVKLTKTKWRRGGKPKRWRVWRRYKVTVGPVTPTTEAEWQVGERNRL